nr:rhomboid family intramembrane serine protease [Sneathiella chinensis]
MNTHMILHHDFMHMLVNAFMLLAFGSMVERTFGPVRFVIVFLVAGWVGAILEALVSMPVTEPSLLYGASGGVFGTMGVTTLLMLPKFGLRGVVSFAAVLMGVNLVIGLTPLGALLAGEGATISWAAHVGGYVTGLLFAIWFLSRLARRP